MKESSGGNSEEVRCFSCSRTDRDVALLSIRFKGEDKWVCAKCLPRLIHG